MQIIRLRQIKLTNSTTGSLPLSLLAGSIYRCLCSLSLLYGIRFCSESAKSVCRSIATNLNQFFPKCVRALCVINPIPLAYSSPFTTLPVCWSALALSLFGRLCVHSHYIINFLLALPNSLSRLSPALSLPLPLSATSIRPLGYIAVRLFGYLRSALSLCPTAPFWALAMCAREKGLVRENSLGFWL